MSRCDWDCGNEGPCDADCFGAQVGCECCDSRREHDDATAKWLREMDAQYGHLVDLARSIKDATGVWPTVEEMAL